MKENSDWTNSKTKSLIWIGHSLWVRFLFCFVFGEWGTAQSRSSLGNLYFCRFLLSQFPSGIMFSVTSDSMWVGNEVGAENIFFLCNTVTSQCNTIKHVQTIFCPQKWPQLCELKAFLTPSPALFPTVVFKQTCV